MKFKDYLRDLNKVKIGFLANKGKLNAIIFLKFNNYFQKSCKTKKKVFSTNKVKSSNYKFYQEEYKRFTCKIIRSVFLKRQTCKSEF